MNVRDLTLVTGANGHIGSHIVRQLIEKGKAVRAFVRPTGDLRGLEGLSVQLVYGDVLDRDSVKCAVEGCGVVYHAAAVFALWARDNSVILRTAIEGSRNVVSESAEAGVKKIIYTSSTAAIGLSRSSEGLLTEEDFNEDRTAPAYVIAKTDSETAAREMAKRLGIHMCVINPGLVLGPGDFKPTPSNSLVRQFVKLGSPVYYEGGANIVDVDDVASGHLLAGERGRDGERYIIGGDNISVLDLMKTLAEITGRSAPRIRLGRGMAMAAGLLLENISRFTGKPPLFTFRNARTYIGRYGYYDISKARDELGYTHKPYREVLERTVRWFRNRV